MTTPSTSAQGPVAGWKLVPVEPTAEMRQAGERAWMNRNLTCDDTDPLSDCFRAMLTASPSPAASPASPSGVRVKPLEWVDLSDCCIAHTPFGVYKVAQAGETVSMFIARSELPKSFHMTIDEAKAAAQADYEARILSALASDATPAATSGSEDGGEAVHPLAAFPDGLHPGLYRIHWNSGGASEAAIGMQSDGTRWIAPTNWIRPGMVASAGEWGEIEHADRIDTSEPAAWQITNRASGSRDLAFAPLADLPFNRERFLCEPLYLDKPASEPAGVDVVDDLVSRAEVLRVIRALGDQDADLALYGSADNARSREYGEASATRACCAIALMPAALSPSAGPAVEPVACVTIEEVGPVCKYFTEVDGRLASLGLGTHDLYAHPAPATVESECDTDFLRQRRGELVIERDAARDAVEDLIAAIGNDGKVTSLHEWNERMQRAVADAKTAIARNVRKERAALAPATEGRKS